MSDIVEDARAHLKKMQSLEVAALEARSKCFSSLDRLNNADKKDQHVQREGRLKEAEDALLLATERREDAWVELAEAKRIAATGLDVHHGVAGGAL